MDTRRHVEQIEVIEHTVTEGRRPIGSGFVPTTEYHSTAENFVTSATNNVVLADSDKRFQLTGERDFSREPSFLHQSAGGLREVPLTTPERSGINNYGYDVHEVFTSDSGARIVQSHGSGFVDSSPLQPNYSSTIMHDRSLDTVLPRESTGRDLEQQQILRQTQLGTAPGNVSTTSEHLHSILKTSDEWRRLPYADESSLSRKDSYKKMQESQMENISVYAPSSNATILPKDKSKTEWAYRTRRDNGEGCWARTKNSFANFADRLRNKDWTARSICAALLCLLCFFLLIFILYLIFNSLFTSYSVRTLFFYPPACEECVRKNPSASLFRPASKVYIHYSSPAQAHFEVVGNPPLKSNSFTAVDFETGYAAIADHALVNSRGQHTTCFLMELDRSALPSMSVLRDGLDESHDEVRTQYGWQEYWQYIAEPIEGSQVVGKFRDDIADCHNVKWYFLKHTVYTKDERCTQCYDFCLPDFAVLRRQKYEDEVTVSIRRLNCFRLYVPEWNRFSIKPDEYGGHWEYPMEPRNTERDAYGNWVSWNPTTFVQQEHQT